MCCKPKYRANMIHHIIFASFLYFFYHSSCRKAGDKDQFTFILLHEKSLRFDWLSIEQWYFSLIWNTCIVKITKLLRVVVWTNNSMICTWYWHWYHSRCFKIVSNFTRLTAREITHQTISKYHSWYLRQISLKNMLLPILILKFMYSRGCVICWLSHFRHKKGTGAEIRVAIVSGIVTRD